MALPIEPKRGEIWWVALDPTQGSEIKKTRPGVVISSDSVRKLPVRLVVPLTEWDDRFYNRMPWIVRIVPSNLNGLDKIFGADTLQSRCLSNESRFTKPIGKLEPDLLDEVAAAMALLVDYQPKD